MNITILPIKGYQPKAAYKGDAGADCLLRLSTPIKLHPGKSAKIPLGFSLRLPVGIMGKIITRSSTPLKHGLQIHEAPIDSGYTGEAHAIITNISKNKVELKDKDRLCQLVLIPIHSWDSENIRGDKAFGSSDNEL